jgi:hypothetical protein
MDLIAGDAREILLAIGIEDWAGLHDPRRFVAYISLGGGMDPAWLDLFSRAARETAGSHVPAPFTESSHPLEGRQAQLSERTIERVEPDWIDDVALLPDGRLDPIAARWIDLIDGEECPVEPDDKPMLRELAGELVQFCRRAAGAEDVLFAWSI